MSGSQKSEAMLLTPPMPAAIAVVRLRGPGVVAFLSKYFSKEATPGRCVHGTIRADDRVIDDPVVLLGDSGDWADVSLHGGPRVIAEFLELARGEGFSVVDPGVPLPESTTDGDLPVLEREMLAHLPLAKTELAIRRLLEQPQLWRAVDETFDAARALGDRSLWNLLHPPQVAIVGEPNVGKSTLANQLFGQERSITADVPGTTRDWVGELADIDGLAVTLVDTPGVRRTSDAIESAAISSGRQKIHNSDLLILVFDATASPTAVQFTKSVPCITVVNKIDQTPAWEVSAMVAIQISAKTGEGILELRSQIRRQFGLGDFDETRPCWWTERQRDLLARAASDPKILSQIWA